MTELSEAAGAHGPHLIYFADPMCSWCYGFQPVIEQVEQTFEEVLPIRLILGGLRPGNTVPMTAKAGADLQGHWDQIHEASGQPFGPSVITTGTFVYDTDPACRAVALARRQSPALGLAMLKAAHTAFYLRGLDVTSRDVLADLAAELGEDRAVFRAALDDETLSRETWNDYELSQNTGVSGFPTLIVGPNADGTFAMITRGFNGLEPVVASIQQWLALQ